MFFGLVRNFGLHLQLASVFPVLTIGHDPVICLALTPESVGDLTPLRSTTFGRKTKYRGNFADSISTLPKTGLAPRAPSKPPIRHV